MPREMVGVGRGLDSYVLVAAASILRRRMPDHRILVLSGTNRPNSNTLKIARVVLDHYKRQDLLADLYDLTDLPPEVFLPTVYASKPAAFQEVQQRVID